MLFGILGIKALRLRRKMNKRFKLKKWLTLDEAVIQISNVLGEAFTLADIYQFELDGHLTLSVNFINIVKGKKVTFIKKEDIKYKKVDLKFKKVNIEDMQEDVQNFLKNAPEMRGDRSVDIPSNALYPISKNLWLGSIESKVVRLSGVWDLSMIGSESFNIKQLYQKEISSGIEVRVSEALNVYVKGAEDSYELQQLLTMEQYRENNNITEKNRISDSLLAYPEKNLDKLDHVLVMRVKEVTRFIESLEDSPQEDKPLHDKERTKFLLLLGSILKKANFDLNERGIAGKIRRATESNNTPVSEQAIRDLLPSLRDTIELKQK